MAKRKKAKREQAVRVVQQALFGIPLEESRPRGSCELIAMDFESHAVRVVFIHGEPWWVLFDVAQVLGYRDTEKASRLLRPKHTTTPLEGCLQLRRNTVLVSEAGLYRLMMRSDRPEAERFQDWITDEVLPSIRRTGTYQMRSPRLERVAKRLNSDLSTAQTRCEVIDSNKQANARLAAEGASNPREFAAWHTAYYVGAIGATVKDMRERGGLRDWETPLDHMSEVLLAQRLHATKMAELRIRERRQETGKPLPFDAQVKIHEETARYLAQTDFANLGSDYAFGITECPRRGPLFDIVRLQLADNSN